VTTVFLWCAIVGGAVTVFQLVAGIVGLDHGHVHTGDHGDSPTEGLNLLSIRSLSAGVAFFGIAGLAARPFGSVAASVAAVAAGTAATLGVAAIVRTFGRLERDATLSLESAVGNTGSVYLSIPGHRSGAGKVHVTVQNRLVECRAVTDEEELPTGAPILVVDVDGSDTVVVVRNPILLTEASNVGA
jgi:membrane protein implicated in regulation of membrane protease activity